MGVDNVTLYEPVVGVRVVCPQEEPVEPVPILPRLSVLMML